MDGFDVSTAPQAYRDIEWIANTFVFLMGVGWCVNYVGMVRSSLQERTYGMAILPLCSNLAWEVVYGVIYPSKSRLEQTVFVSGLLLNVGVMCAAVTFAPCEWHHAPLVQRHLTLIFTLSILLCLSAHLALAAHIGPSLAYSWGAIVCQLLLSIGGLCQLVVRGSTRGGSYTLW
jgi:paspaline synthase